MNILCYRYGSIVEPDIIDGFKELGNQVSEICLEIYNKNTTPLEGLTALKDELMRHSYDFVFSINFYPFIAEVCNIFQIRYLCLTVDAPVLELFSNSIRLPWNRIFLFDRAVRGFSSTEPGMYLSSSVSRQSCPLRTRH